MTVGELFAGIGGIGLGLERAGMEVKWAIENDPYACAVYRKNFPQVQMIEQDIATVHFGYLEWVDLLVGGFPCQDISCAGKGAGIEGSRSGLWKEFWRAICILRPRLVLVENVPALLSRGLGVIHGDLAALGYNPESDCIPAAAVGAPHRRDRVFIVAQRSDKRSNGRERFTGNALFESRGGGDNGRGSDSDRRGEDVADSESERVEGNGTAGEQEPRTPPEAEILGRYCAGEGSSQWELEPDVGRVAHGVPSRVDRLRCLGNAVVPQIAEWIGRRIMEVYG